MAPTKKAGSPPRPTGVSRPQYAIRDILVITGIVAAALCYWQLFLAQPILEGNAQPDQAPITRGGFVQAALVYPEAIVSSWFDGGRLPNLFSDRMPIALATILWLALACVIGWPVVASGCTTSADASRINTIRIEKCAWSTLVGLACLSTLTLLVGLAGGLSSRWPLLLAIVALLAICLPLSYRLARQSAGSQPLTGPQEVLPATSDAWTEREPGGANRNYGLFDRALRLLAVVFTIWLASCIMLGAWVPSSEFDVTEYHLQAPKEFFEAGAIRFLPHNVYANMPLGVEMHTLAAMALIGDSDTWFGGLVGKSITASLTLLGALLLGIYLARRRDSICGWWAAGLWLASPGIAHVSVLGLIDGALATYVLATVIAAIRAWVQSRSVDSMNVDSVKADINGSQPRRLHRDAIVWWTIAGTMAGAAASTKYPGLVYAVVPLALIMLSIAVRSQYLRRGRPSAQTLTRTGALVGCFVLGLAITCAPWYAKNWLLTGNPVYPLVATVFGGETLTPEKIEQWQQAHQVPPAAPSDAGFTKRVTAASQRLLNDLSRLLLTSSYVQPSMILGLALMVIVLLSHRATWTKHWWAWFAWSMWIVAVWWLATHRIDRFWLPLTGLWSGMAALAFYWLRQRVSAWLAHAIIIGGIGYGAIVNCSPVISDNRYFVALSALRDDTGDDQQVPRISREQAWINRHLEDRTVRVLLIGEARVFEYRVPILYSTCFDTNPGEELLRDKTAAQQAANLRAHGITHIMVNWSEIARYRSPGNYGFSAWPQRSDIDSWIAAGIVEPVDWGLPREASQLLEVHKADVSERSAVD